MFGRRKPRKNQPKGKKPKREFKLLGRILLGFNAMDNNPAHACYKKIDTIDIMVFEIGHQWRSERIPLRFIMLIKAIDGGTSGAEGARLLLALSCKRKSWKNFPVITVT